MAFALDVVISAPVIGLASWLSSRFTVRVILSAVLALAALACSGQDRELAERIHDACVSGSARLDLADFPDVPWDRLYVFPPYSHEALVEAELPGSWVVLANSGIESRDDVTLLVFAEAGAVQAFVELPRTCDFAGVERAGGWPPSEASFVVQPGLVGSVRSARIRSTAPGG